MLWLAELASRAVWHATDGGVRFVAAMISVGLSVVVVVRLVRRFGAK